MSEFSLLLAFDRDTPDFAYGVEVGRLWEMARGDGVIEQQIHACNAEMAMRIAEATGREFRAEVLDELWVELWMGEPREEDE